MLVKIGMTSGSPYDRAAALSSTGVPQPFLVAFYEQFVDCAAAERAVHEAFADYRTNDGREFFAVEVKQVIEYIQRMDGKAEDTDEAAGDEVRTSRDLYFYVGGFRGTRALVRFGLFAKCAGEQFRAAREPLVPTRLANDLKRYYSPIADEFDLQLSAPVLYEAFLLAPNTREVRQAANEVIRREVAAALLLDPHWQAMDEEAILMERHAFSNGSAYDVFERVARQLRRELASREVELREVGERAGRDALRRHWSKSKGNF